MTTPEPGLKEARATLKTLCMEYFQTYDDFCAARKRQTLSITAARDRDRQEKEKWEQYEQYYRFALRQWHLRESREAIISLERRKTWYYQLVLIIACLLSCGLFLILEKRARQSLRSRRENPPLGPLQRTWIANLEEAQRHMASLRSLQDPRPTQEMREAQEEVHLLQKKRNMIYRQVLLQKEQFNALQQERSSSSPI